MRRFLFRHTGMLVVLGVLFTFFAMSWVMYDNTEDYFRDAVTEECKIYKYSLDRMGKDYLTGEAGALTGSRITLIGADGTVLYDSVEDVRQMGDHSGRPEFTEAREKGRANVVRYSETLREQTFYTAMALEDGSVIRVSFTTDTVLGFMLHSAWLMGLLIAGLLAVALVLTGRMAARMIRPINQIDLEHPLDNAVYEELSPLLGRIYQQQKQIREQMDAIRHAQEEYQTITGNMKDGLIVTNRSAVLSINRAAQNLFGVTEEECVNHDIVTVSRNDALKEALGNALDGRAGERNLEVGGRVYQLLANPVSVDSEVFGAVILVLDVTEKQKAELTRREFSANVSHELKTPLMSISGYAEIMENGLVKPEDVPAFAGRIHEEASRLAALVEDIIRLSRLDEGDPSMEMEEVPLLALCREAGQHLAMRAEEYGVSLHVSGTEETVHGVRQVLYEMVFNLCDNAVKYNRKGGRVEVSVSRNRTGRPVLTVSDTGIGIAKEDQQRIFERFYRVDKSRSRESGGTGLGLSIVKHGAILHDARILLESRVGEGTSIQVVF